MTPHVATTASRPRIVGLIRAIGRKLSDRVHAPADDRGRALGWTVTETPGRLGLRGRRYHDPQFATRRKTASTCGPEGDGTS